jgi:hypothetical protein
MKTPVPSPSRGSIPVHCGEACRKRVRKHDSIARDGLAKSTSWPGKAIWRPEDGRDRADKGVCSF